MLLTLTVIRDFTMPSRNTNLYRFRVQDIPLLRILEFKDLKNCPASSDRWHFVARQFGFEWIIVARWFADLTYSNRQLVKDTAEYPYLVYMGKCHYVTLNWSIDLLVWWNPNQCYSRSSVQWYFPFHFLIIHSLFEPATCGRQSKEYSLSL